MEKNRLKEEQEALKAKENQLNEEEEALKAKENQMKNEMEVIEKEASYFCKRKYAQGCSSCTASPILRWTR